MNGAVQLITPELRAWIVAQAQAGQEPQAVLAAMRASGWDEAVALDALEQTVRGFVEERAGAAPAAPAAAMPEPALAASSHCLDAGDREVDVLVSLRHPRVVVLSGLLSATECEELMALARRRLARSQTVDNATGGTEVNEARTSEGMFFERGEFDVCRRIEQRIATLLAWPVENGEGLQVLRYRPGAQYRPHHDYFDPAEPGTPAVLQRGGQRVGTVVMYLNTPTRGGATTFPGVGLEVAPMRGNAVFFSYARAHPDTRTLHGGAPVIEGEKWVATKWLRERRFE